MPTGSGHFIVNTMPLSGNGSHYLPGSLSLVYKPQLFRGLKLLKRWLSLCRAKKRFFLDMPEWLSVMRAIVDYSERPMDY
jgi:hypothetical protein